MANLFNSLNFQGRSHRQIWSCVQTLPHMHTCTHTQAHLVWWGQGAGCVKTSRIVGLCCLLILLSLHLPSAMLHLSGCPNAYSSFYLYKSREREKGRRKIQGNKLWWSLKHPYTFPLLTLHFMPPVNSGCYSRGQGVKFLLVSTAQLGW